MSSFLGLPLTLKVNQMVIFFDMSNSKPFFSKQISPILDNIITSSQTTEEEKSVSFTVSHLLERNETHVVTAFTTKALNRYSIQPGKIFGTSAKHPEKYKVVRLIADDVVLHNFQTGRNEVRNINKLLEEWAQKGIKEISFLEEVIRNVKSMLGPFLGVFLTTALIAWLTEQVKKV